MTDTDDSAPGWDALEAALVPVVGDVAPVHYATGNLPDQDGPYGLHAYPLDGHWLMLTLGLSELFTKVSDDPDVSGWGLELTLRIPRSDADQTPPAWSLNLLRSLGAYMYSSGRTFSPGHRMNPGGPITGTPGTRLNALAFAADPQVPSLTSPFGHVDLVTVFGITTDELADGPDSTGVIDAHRQGNPLLVTDPDR